MVLDKEKVADTLFSGFKKSKTPSPKPQSAVATLVAARKPSDHKPSETIAKATVNKWESLDRVIVLFTTEQKDGLDRLSKKIMKARPKKIGDEKKRERITTNTLLRVLADILLEVEPSSEFPTIFTEEDAKKWVKGLLNQ